MKIKQSNYNFLFVDMTLGEHMKFSRKQISSQLLNLYASPFLQIAVTADGLRWNELFRLMVLNKTCNGFLFNKALYDVTISKCDIAYSLFQIL